MKNAIFITARLGSSRLPRKHLLKIQGRCCIDYVIERARRSEKAERIIMCTTDLDEDDVLCDFAWQHGIDYYRGSVLDKLDRWLCATEKFDVDFFVTYDADDLFCEPELMDLAFNQYKKTNADFIEWDEANLICGAFTYGIKTEALRKVCESKKSKDTEMMWVYFKEGNFLIENLNNVPEVFRRPEIRATLDYIEDFNFFKNVIEHFGHNGFSLRDVIQYLDSNPGVIDINISRHIDWKNNQMRKVEEADEGKSK